jgi:hypothetical protein
MATVVAHTAATVVLVALVWSVLRSAPSSRKWRYAALEEVMESGGEFRERQKVGATESEWSVKIEPRSRCGGEENSEH